MGSWTRILLAAYSVMFGASAVSKLGAWAAWRRTISALLPPAGARKLALVGVPLAELSIALLLLMTPREGMAAAFVLLALFTVTALWAGVKRPNTPCACFGASKEALGPRLAVRNMFLLAGLGGIAIVDPPSRFSIETMAAVAPMAAVLLTAAALHDIWRKRSARGLRGGEGAWMTRSGGS